MLRLGGALRRINRGSIKETSANRNSCLARELSFAVLVMKTVNRFDSMSSGPKRSRGSVPEAGTYARSSEN